MKNTLAVLCLVALGTMTARAEDTAAYVFLPMFSQQIVLRQPEGWQQASGFRDEHREVVEFLPEGEDHDYWTERVRIMAYASIARQTAYGPDVILRTLGQQLHEHCETTVISKSMEHLSISGYAAVTWLIGCPRLRRDSDDEEAQGEMGFYLAIKGRNDFYVIEHALHTGIFSPGLEPMTQGNFLAYAAKTSPVALCSPGDSLSICLKALPHQDLTAPGTPVQH